MKIDIVSVFPEYFEVLNLSLFGKAQAKGLIDVSAHNLRDWTHDVHHSVDDTPVGGGAGMVMKPEEFPKGYFVPGRMAMTCCAEDMTFLGFACVYDKIDLYQERDWVKVTAVVKKEYFADYEGEGPVLYAESVTKAKQPKEPVISFT